MNEIISFLLHHWVLSITFIILVGLLIYVEVRGSAGGAKKILPQKVVQLMNRENALVIDVRDRNIYLAGHLTHSLHISPSELIGNKKIEGYKVLPLILVCGNGMQSPGLATKLMKEGYTHVYYLQGGINVWREQNLPLVK